MVASEGKRDQLIDILLACSSNLPGCLSYIIAKDVADRDGIWITEVWKSKQKHQVSLTLPSVQAAIAKGRH
jgi:quinol monooxygenase YgiN